MMRTLFLQAPSFDGFDGGAGSRYQARREIRSFWYPTWLAQPAALVENSKLIDAPPHSLRMADIAARDTRRSSSVLGIRFLRRIFTGSPPPAALSARCHGATWPAA